MAIKGDGGKKPAPPKTTKARERERTSGALRVATPKIITAKPAITKAQERERTSGALKRKTPVTVTVRPGDTNASIAERLGVNPEIAKQYVPVVPRVGTQVTVPVTGAPVPIAQTLRAPWAPPFAAQGPGAVEQAPRTPTTGYDRYVRAPGAAPPVSGRPLALARESTSGALKPGTPPKFTSGWLTPSEARGGLGYGPSTAIFTGAGTQADAVKAAAWRVQTFLQELGVRPEFITADVKGQLGLSVQQMESMGYALAPNGQWYRINFGDTGPAAGATSSYAAGYDYGGGGGGYGGGYGARAELISWRIGL